MPLFRPGRCIAVPVVFYRFAQESSFRVWCTPSLWTGLPPSTVLGCAAAATPKRKLGLEARLRQVFHRYRLFYSDLDRDQLLERICEAGRDWDATRSEVSQVMRGFYKG